jgi:hypothetical protein
MPNSGDAGLCLVDGLADGDALTTIEANAQLIAAAPDLLAALRDIIGSCRKAGVAIVDLSRGDAAIRKAETGE